MDYLHMQLCLRKMNEEHVASSGMCERDTTGPFNTNTGVCWEITGECSFRGRRKCSTNCFPPFYRFQISVQNLPGSNQLGPEASADHQLILAPAVGFSVRGAKASNRGLQQTNPDSSSHLRFTLGQLWCHPTRRRVERWRGAGSSQYNVCRVSAHPGWQQHEHLSQKTSVLLSHSTAGQSIWGSAIWTLLIVIYLGGVIMLSREMTEE